MTNTTFIPGDPWLTGHAQVYHDLSGALVGGVHILKYSGTLPLGASDIELGHGELRGATRLSCAPLRESGSLPLAVAVTDQLDPRARCTGEPATLEALCQAR